MAVNRKPAIVVAGITSVVAVGLLGAAVGGLVVYAQFAVPLESKLDQAAVQQVGCEVVKDLFVPAKFKPNRPQFMFKQPEQPIQ